MVAKERGSAPPALRKAVAIESPDGSTFRTKWLGKGRRTKIRAGLEVAEDTFSMIEGESEEGGKYRS